MAYDFTHIPKERTGFECYRLDVWGGNGVHRISYFRENENGQLELTAQTAGLTTGHTISEGKLTQNMEDAVENEGFEIAGL